MDGDCSMPGHIARDLNATWQPYSPATRMSNNEWALKYIFTFPPHSHF